MQSAERIGDAAIPAFSHAAPDSARFPKGRHLMDRTTELVTIQETARLIRVTYPRVAPRLAAHATKAIALFDLHTEARQNGGKSAADEIGLQITDSFAEWVKLRDEDTTWRNLIAKVAKLAGLALPHIDNTLRFVVRDSEAWHSIPCFDWEAAKAELLRIESEAVAALARLKPEVSKTADTMPPVSITGGTMPEVTVTARQPTAPVGESRKPALQPEDRDHKWTWQAVQDELEQRRLRGHVPTSQRELAESIGCSVSTISKAVHNGPVELQEWIKKQRAPRRNERSLHEITGYVSLSHEIDPTDVWDPADIDEALQQLLTDADREGKRTETEARLKEMRPDERERLARAYTEQLRDAASG